MGGIVNKINSALIYPSYGYVFNEFVECFEKFRKINDTYKTLGKLMINSFYGRTGLKPREEISFFIQNEKELSILLNLSNIGKIEITFLEEVNKI